MPSPSRRLAPRRPGSSPASLSASSPSRRTRSNVNIDESVDNVAMPTDNRQHQVVGKRTGVTLPPRGEIPLDANGFESVDAFWDAAKSPASNASREVNRAAAASAGRRQPSPSAKTKAKRAEKARQRELREEEQRKKREELEEEERENLARGPSLLQQEDQQIQQTPKQLPPWTNRALHKAMGIPTADSPAYTVLSRVSTAPPSTVATIATNASEKSASVRHAVRENQAEVQLEDLARRASTMVGVNSPEALVLDPSTVDSGEGSGSDKGMDPPETDGGGIGMTLPDPEEKDHWLEPPEEGGSQMEEEEKDEEEESKEKIMEDEKMDEEEKEEEEEEVEFPQHQGDLMSTTLSSIAEESSQQSQKSASQKSVGTGDNDGQENREETKDANSEKTTPSRALDETIEDMVGTYDKEYNDGNDDDDDKESGSGFQLATQEEPPEEDDVNFDSGGGQDDDFDAVSHHSSSLSKNEDSDAASRHSTNRSRNGDLDAASRHSSNRSRNEDFDTVSHQSSKRSRNQEEGHESERDVEEEEAEVPQKKKAKAKKEIIKDRAPTTPSALRKKGSKKRDPNQRVNWSTPSGNAAGYAIGNRDYEAVPVSDYKDEYPSGQEPRTPGGTPLRRSKRAKFKPLQFWKNEKLIYEANNEEGELGEAMGDMPVVTGVLHALPTPYKERKVRASKPKQAHKGSQKGSNDDQSDEETSSNRTPFDDSKLRKKYNIRNGESGSVWSETIENTMETKLVSRLENRSFSKLPLSTSRKKHESKIVGFASQAFHVLTDDDDLFPGYIAGNVVLPPRGIKDAEGVGLCSQVFNVGDCQPNSVEFAIADPSGQDGEFDPSTAQRYLLSKGDMFQIPPGNVYRIENHSKTDKASLFWTIIKCTSRAEQGSDEDDDEE